MSRWRKLKVGEIWRPGYLYAYVAHRHGKTDCSWFMPLKLDAQGHGSYLSISDPQIRGAAWADKIEPMGHVSQTHHFLWLEHPPTTKSKLAFVKAVTRG